MKILHLAAAATAGAAIALAMQLSAAPAAAPLAQSSTPPPIGVIKDLPADCGDLFCIIPKQVLREVVTSHNEKSLRLERLEAHVREIEQKAKASSERVDQLQRRY